MNSQFSRPRERERERERPRGGLAVCLVETMTIAPKRERTNKFSQQENSSTSPHDNIIIRAMLDMPPHTHTRIVHPSFRQWLVFNQHLNQIYAYNTCNFAALSQFSCCDCIMRGIRKNKTGMKMDPSSLSPIPIWITKERSGWQRCKEQHQKQKKKRKKMKKLVNLFIAFWWEWSIFTLYVSTMCLLPSFSVESTFCMFVECPCMNQQQ